MPTGGRSSNRSSSRPTSYMSNGFSTPKNNFSTSTTTSNKTETKHKDTQHKDTQHKDNKEKHDNNLKQDKDTKSTTKDNFNKQNNTTPPLSQVPLVQQNSSPWLWGYMGYLLGSNKGTDNHHSYTNTDTQKVPFDKCKNQKDLFMKCTNENKSDDEKCKELREKLEECLKSN